MLTLVKPNSPWQAEAEAFKNEFFAAGETVINGSSLWDKTERYGDWLALVWKNASSETVAAGWVPADVYFAVRGQKIIGIIDLRHCLNDFLKDLGHSGFSVRPSERRKGFGAQMLGLVLNRARTLGLEEVLLSCKQSNEGSRKVIVKNGGVRIRSFVYEGAPADVYRILLWGPTAAKLEKNPPFR